MLKKASIFAASALALTLSATPLKAEPPDQNSKQMDRMKAYKVFITTMKNNNGVSCCNWADGRMGDGGEELKEERTPHPDGTITYRVFVTPNIFGKDSRDIDHPDSPSHRDYDLLIPPEGKWFDVPPTQVLETYQSEAKKCFAERPDCVAPPDNILWLSNQGYVWCYFPIQNWTENQPSRFARLEP